MSIYIDKHKLFIRFNVEIKGRIKEIYILVMCKAGLHVCANFLTGRKERNAEMKFETSEIALISFTAATGYRIGLTVSLFIELIE